MNFKNGQQIKTARAWHILALIAICAVVAVSHAGAQIAPPDTPSLIAVPEVSANCFWVTPVAFRAARERTQQTRDAYHH